MAGTDADKPTEIPARGWLQILKRAWAEGKEDNISLLAAGVAFFGFLALFPALIASLTIYGLLVSPQRRASRSVSTPRRCRARHGRFSQISCAPSPTTVTAR